jgi:hypothetical protein
MHGSTFISSNMIFDSVTLCPHHHKLNLRFDPRIQIASLEIAEATLLILDTHHPLT